MMALHPVKGGQRTLGACPSEPVVFVNGIPIGDPETVVMEGRDENKSPELAPGS